MENKTSLGLDWLMPSFPDWMPKMEPDILQVFRDLPGFQSAIRLRQVHALEHATLSILGQRGVASASHATLAETTHQDDPSLFEQQLGGIATDRGFYVYGQFRRLDLVRAAKEALERLTQGEWQLAIHPRCGTNWPIQLLLQSGWGLGLQSLLSKGVISQLMGLRSATSLTSELAPELETWWQRYIMTAPPLNLELVEITPTTDDFGTPAHFVEVDWIEDSGYA